MNTTPRKLHVVFLPFMASGHSIPMLDIVRLFAAREHVKSTVITTPLNAPNVIKSLKNSKTSATSTIDVHVIQFPSQEAGLLEGIENLDQVTSHEMILKFIFLAQLLRDPVERFLEKIKLDCLVADYFFPFATDLAKKFGVPRLVFHVMGLFSICGMVVVRQSQPEISVLSDDESFIIPKLPHEVKMTKSQILRTDTDLSNFYITATKAATESHGEIFNSFFELEPDYVNYYKNVIKRKCWPIGPVSLTNRSLEEKFYRGKTASISEHKCLEWLDCKEPDSVIYICFGSTTKFSGPQLNEIALALESSGLGFLWVLSKGKGEEEEGEEWLCDGFEERIKNKGLIVRGWAPQVMILEHKAVCGFMTHCGWNSTLEAVSSGIPMVTWPELSDQFYNEKLITDILKIGVQVGSKKWKVMGEGTFIKSEKIETAMTRIMEGEEALEMRSRAKGLKDLARKAVEEGGSSYSNLSSLIHELRSR